MSSRGDAYLSVRRKWWELEGRGVHKDGAPVTVKVVQERREGLFQAKVAADVRVAGRLGGQPEGHPALGSVADRPLLAAHTVAAAAQTGGTDD